MSRERLSPDIESDAGSDAGISPSEQSPLLQNDLPTQIVPSKSFQRKVMAMCILMLFIVEVSQFIMEPPLQKIMEDIICRNRYPDHALRVPQIQDDRCKNFEVQKTLAMLRGWGMAVEMAVPIVAQVPFGIIADKYGRRPVLFSSLFGCTLQCAWQMMVLLFPDTFSIWAVLPGAIFYLIGGGGPMAGAMVWTLIADVIPVTERTAVFNQVNAFMMILKVVINPISALLLRYDPWLAMWLGFAFLTTGTFSALLIPETLRLRQKADSDRRHDPSQDEPFSTESDESYESTGIKRNALKHLLFTVKNDMSHIWRFIFASKSIMILIVALSVFYPMRIAIEVILLQYMTKRFHWEWSKATFISTIGTLITVIALLVILPGATALLSKLTRQSLLSKDLWLTRGSIVFVAAGSFLMSVASVPGLFVLSLVIQSLGFGFTPLCRALLNAVVEPHTVATLNTTISLVETLTGLIGGPVFGWLLGKGMEMGGSWLGLPFLVMTVLGVGVSVAVFRFRLPGSVAQAHET